MSDWRYLAERLTGDGAGEIFESELPIEVESLSENLSAPPTMEGKITGQVKRLLASDGRRLLEPWGTAIYAVAGDEIKAGCIFKGSTFNGATWDIDTVGFTGYPQGMPYDGESNFVGADPLDIYRHIWTHLQAQKNGNLGITVDSLKSPVRVGTPATTTEFETSSGEGVAFESGPRKLNWWETKDLGEEIDSYAKETPFDWLERHFWEGSTIRHHIDLGYPRIGSRRDDLTGFVYGSNLNTEPSITEGEYANQVYALGAGEGRDRVRGYAGVTDGRLRRARVIENKGDRSVQAAKSRASDSLKATRGDLVVEELSVIDHPNAPLRGIHLGDEVQLYADTDWATVDQWVRVVGRRTRPGVDDVATFTVVRTVEL
jgi:hypothetical protein